MAVRQVRVVAVVARLANPEKQIRPLLSIIINEESNLGSLLSELQHLLPDDDSEILVVDGGSQDQTCKIAQQYPVTLLASAQAGRAVQMNLGAAHAKGKLLVFLHADTRLPQNAFELLKPVGENQWGFFSLKLSGRMLMLRLVEAMINLRSRLSELGTGDQTLFVGATLFTRMGGFANIPLMEDVEFSKRLRMQVSPRVFSEPVITSSRRWEKKGILRTIVLMWYLRLRYFMGASPESLVTKYYPQHTS